MHGVTVTIVHMAAVKMLNETIPLNIMSQYQTYI
jgi:hypothetical protein